MSVLPEGFRSQHTPPIRHYLVWPLSGFACSLLGTSRSCLASYSNNSLSVILWHLRTRQLSFGHLTYTPSRKPNGYPHSSHWYNNMFTYRFNVLGEYLNQTIKTTRTLLM